MKKLFKRYTITLLSIVSLWFIAACSKEIKPEQTELGVSRLFSPTDVTATISNRTAVILRWKEVRNALTYTAEVFGNGNMDFTGTPEKTYTDIKFTQVPYTIAGLEGNKNFSVRIKAVGEDVDESKWVGVTFKTDPEQILSALAPADLTSNSVILKWAIPNEVTHIVLNSTRYDITGEEKTEGTKTITGLTPKTDYSLEIRNNAALRGTATFRTPANIPTGPNVYELSASSNLTELFKTVSLNAIFVLREGVLVNQNDQLVIPENASYTFFGEEGSARPILAANGFTLPGIGGTLKFENLDLTGFAEGDPTKSKRNYIFNQSAKSTTDKVIFENCIIRNFVNTPFRMQGSNAITVDSLIFNRCVAYDIGVNSGGNGTYAFIHNSVANSKINHIKVINSTLYDIGYAFILHNLAPAQSVTVENCTFNNVTGDARYFIDYNAQSAGSFVFNNNIVGKTLSPAGTARGIRSSATPPTVTNSYKTSDAVFAANPIPSITAYEGTSTALFTNPANGLFSFKDAGFAGKATAGDPRWRP